MTEQNDLTEEHINKAKQLVDDWYNTTEFCQSGGKTIGFNDNEWKSLEISIALLLQQHCDVSAGSTKEKS